MVFDNMMVTDLSKKFFEVYSDSYWKTILRQLSPLSPTFKVICFNFSLKSARSISKS